MTDPQSTHPIVAVVSDIRSLLKAAAGVNPTFMSTDDKATALSELVRAEAQLAELRLRVLADAGDLADVTGAKDPAAWLVHQTRTRFAAARATSRSRLRWIATGRCSRRGCATAWSRSTRPK